MGMILFCMTFTCIVSIVFNLFVIELSGTLDLEAFSAVFNLSHTLALTFAYFYLAEWITSDLLDIEDIFYNSAWYRLPAKQQKLMVLPIQRAGRPLHMKCVGLFDCSLGSFTAVSLF